MIALPHHLEHRVRDLMFVTAQFNYLPDLFTTWLKLRFLLQIILETNSEDPAFSAVLLNRWSQVSTNLWQRLSHTNGFTDNEKRLALLCCTAVEKLRKAMVGIMGHAKTEYTDEQIALARSCFVSCQERAILAHLQLSNTEMGIVFGFLLTTKLPIVQLSPRQWIPHSDSQFEQHFDGFVFTFERSGEGTSKLLMVRREQLPLIPLARG